MSLPDPAQHPIRRIALVSALTAALVASMTGCGTETTNGQEASQTDQSSENSPKLDGTSMPPWPAPSDVVPKVAEAGLDLGPMGMAEHYHPHLRIIIRGQEVPVPANIGVDQATGAMSVVHTHDTDGTIHVEAGTVGEVFTLGQLFTQWGVKLSPTQIGGVRAKAGQQATLTSNGERVAEDPMSLRLKPDQQIVLRLP